MVGALARAVLWLGEGIGNLGLFVQVALRAGQNAADYADLGAATGTLNFFKSMGGAFGAALFGTVLSSGYRRPATLMGGRPPKDGRSQATRPPRAPVAP